MAKKYALTTESRINANLALRHRLYVSRRYFCLSETLNDIRDGYNDEAKVVIHQENGIPVGVAAYDQYDSVNIQIFVRKSMRRKGIGKKLILALNAPKSSIVGVGAITSRAFWEKQENVIIEKY